MSYGLTRLTLYAILSAVEQDLRVLISNYVLVDVSPTDILDAETYQKALKRLENDLGELDGQHEPELILSYLDFADTYKILNTNADLLPENISKQIRKSTSLLEKLVPIRNRVAHSRPLNFDDLAVVADTTEQLLQLHDIPWAELRSVLQNLSDDPSFVLSLQIPSYFLLGTNQNHNLPIPDFDETGFIGRVQQVKDLTRNLMGPYPVITIIGEGGVGKTALALKVAYEILDMTNSPFDAVVWTSSKTRQLTPNDIVRIEGAISDSLGMFQTVAYDLSGVDTDAPIDEILMYLAEFKILLILDNLETVLDTRIRNFLGKLPQGSKVLITSRIGIGAFEYPVKLMPMEEPEAVALLRALAKSRNVTKLTKTNNKDLSNYCKKMKNSPGFIKWFVSAVQAGRRPEEVLDNPAIFLDFCMSNVYEYLADESRYVLDVMLCAPGQLSQAELAFLTQMDVVELQRSLQQLLTTNMVIMASSPNGSSFSSRYELADLPREYLLKYHPPKVQVNAEITKRRRQLIAAEEKAAAEQRKKPYSPYSIVVRSQSDLVVARYLQSAMYRCNQGRIKDAEDEIAQARRLAPEYFEVHRVDAWVKIRQQNITAARNAYEAAIELESKHAPLLYSYGLFLLHYMDDTQEAMKWFTRAAQLDSDSVEIQLGLARASLYLRQFDKSEVILKKIIGNPLVADVDLRKSYDLYLQHFHRLSEYWTDQQELQHAIDALEQLKSVYLQCPARLLDQEMVDKVKKAYVTAQKCIRLSADQDTYQRAFQLSEWIYSLVIPQADLQPLIGRKLKGRIARLPKGKTFGFIRSDTGEEFFFHRSDLYDTSEWPVLREGDTVRFVSNVNDEGLCAVGVLVEEN